MAEFTPVQLHFPPVDGLTVPEDFDNGALSSDFGPLILRGVDRQIGLTERVAAALDDQRHPSHITSKLARRGYTTIAITAFQDIFFKLRSWYPQIGFQQMYFGEELQPKMARSCGAVWLGACDTDVANELTTTLRTRNGPLMVYWLTLNTHIPIYLGEVMARYDCNTPASMFSDPEVCWMAEMWTDVMESIARLALDPTLPPMAILVVGDHAPPLWSRKARRLFRPGEVSWVTLWPHPSVGPDHSHQATVSGSN